MTADLATIGKLADLCRSKGVKSITVDGVTLELLPAEPPPMKSSEAKDPDTCGCGHGLHAHNAGLCLHGCAVEKCAGPDGVVS